MSKLVSQTPSASATVSQQLVKISQIVIKPDQLDRAFQIDGAFGERATKVLEAYAEREGILPVSLAAEALAIRSALFRDLLDQWIEEEDCLPYLEAASAARIVVGVCAKTGKAGSFRFDQEHFNRIATASRPQQLACATPTAKLEVGTVSND